jgi:hypothetical protein
VNLRLLMRLALALRHPMSNRRLAVVAGTIAATLIVASIEWLIRG